MERRLNELLDTTSRPVFSHTAFIVLPKPREGKHKLSDKQALSAHAMALPHDSAQDQMPCQVENRLAG